MLPGHDPVAIVDSLRGRSDVILANVALWDSVGNPVYMTEHVVANFETSAAPAQIDSMNVAHGMVVLDSLFDDPFCCS